MLYLNLSNRMDKLHILSPVRWLGQLGYKRQTASRMIKKPGVRIDLRDLEKLCVALNCTPNDILHWKEDKRQNLAPQHPLHKLKPVAIPHIPVDKIKALPPEQQATLLAIIHETVNGSQSDEASY